jgi:hypothetical protein
MHGPSSRAARWRGALAAAATLGALAALGVLAGASWSATGSSSSHHEYGTKVTICHHTHSKKHPFETITIGAKAAAKLLKHGDTLGACPTTTTTGTTTTTKKGEKDDDGDADDNGTTTSTTSHEGGHEKSGSHGHGDSHGNGHDK